MSNKKHVKNKTPEKTAADYYNLKTDAVDRLVNAENAPAVSDAEIRKYTSGGKKKLPAWLKIGFIKFWFAGAVCYFFMWGLGIYIQGLDLLCVLALGLGVVTDILTNRALRRFEPTEREYDKWMMVTVRQYWSIFLNVAYAGVLLYCVFKTYYVINVVMGVNVDANYAEKTTMLGVEPILFGLFYLMFDLIFIAMKNTLIKIVKDAEAKAGGGEKRE